MYLLTGGITVNRTTSTLSLALAAISLTGVAAHAQENERHHDKIKHVLLLSVDGMHAVDFKNCAEGIPGVNGGEPYCPHLAGLKHTGVDYVAASTSRPSDSFPGLMSIVSGATPRTMGVYYDVAYDRSLDAPALTTGNGVAGGPCNSLRSTPTGTTTEYEEGIDLDQTKLNGGAPGARPHRRHASSLDSDPKKPPPRPRQQAARLSTPLTSCAPTPSSASSTITGGYTAWADKHPAYSLRRRARAAPVLDDFYAPEINSNVDRAAQRTKPSFGENSSCTTIRDTGSLILPPGPIASRTSSCYDQLKVNAILNQIDGKDHTQARRHKTRVPDHLRHELPGSQRRGKAHRKVERRHRRLR